MPRKKKEDAYPRWTPPPVVLPDDDASAIPEMREFAAMVWGEITDVFGNSAYLVSRAVDSLAFMKQARDWVRNLELFVRRMIAVLALSIQLPPARPRTPAARPRPPEEFRRRSGHWMDVQGWHVSFRLTPPVPGDPSGMKRSSDAKPPKTQCLLEPKAVERGTQCRKSGEDRLPRHRLRAAHRIRSA